MQLLVLKRCGVLGHHALTTWTAGQFVATMACCVTFAVARPVKKVVHLVALAAQLCLPAAEPSGEECLLLSGIRLVALNE